VTVESEDRFTQVEESAVLSAYHKRVKETMNPLYDETTKVTNLVREGIKKGKL